MGHVIATPITPVDFLGAGRVKVRESGSFDLVERFAYQRIRKTSFDKYIVWVIGRVRLSSNEQAIVE